MKKEVRAPLYEVIFADDNVLRTRKRVALIENGWCAMDHGVIRIGIVGAGQATRDRHLPGFRAIAGVKVVGVCNLHRESSIKVARDFNIPKVFDSWEFLVEDESIDAVVIGAWPYLHCPITLAALGAGKHVLTQARMAMNAREAQRMLDRARSFLN